MGAGIGWIILGFVYHFIYKKKNDYMYKLYCNTFVVTGIIAIIISIINRIFFKSGILEGCIFALLIPAMIYVLFKMKQYETALKIADKLTEK